MYASDLMPNPVSDRHASYRGWPDGQSI